MRLRYKRYWNNVSFLYQVVSPPILFKYLFKCLGNRDAYLILYCRSSEYKSRLFFPILVAFNNVGVIQNKNNGYFTKSVIEPGSLWVVYYCCYYYNCYYFSVKKISVISLLSYNLFLTPVSLFPIFQVFPCNKITGLSFYI